MQTFAAKRSRVASSPTVAERLGYGAVLGELARRLSGPPPPPDTPPVEHLRFIRRVYLRWAVPALALGAVVLAIAPRTVTYVGVGVIAVAWIALLAVIQARIHAERRERDS